MVDSSCHSFDFAARNFEQAHEDDDDVAVIELLLGPLLSIIWCSGLHGLCAHRCLPCMGVEDSTNLICMEEEDTVIMGGNGMLALAGGTTSLWHGYAYVSHEFSDNLGGWNRSIRPGFAGLVFKAHSVVDSPTGIL